MPRARQKRPPWAKPWLITTDVMRLTFETEGGTRGTHRAAQLRKQMPTKSKPFVLLDESAERSYMAQLA